MKNAKKLLIASAVVLLSACASKPPQYESLATTSNPISEIEKTEEMLNEARQKQVDVLAPRSFVDAEKALKKAKTYREKGKTNADILEQVAYSRGWLQEANTKAEITVTAMPDIQDARSGAMAARSSEVLEKDWKRAETDLKNVTHAVERGSLKQANRKGPDITTQYRDLEIRAVNKTHLSEAQKNIEKAKKDGASSKAPVTYALAQEKLQNAERLIESDPRNLEAIKSASYDATREASYLNEVLDKVKAGNTEELVLASDRQRRQLSTLKNEYSSTEQELAASRAALSETSREKAELQKTAELTQTADEIRRSVPASDAEVFAENGKITVRLKGVQFPSGKATLGAKGRSILERVQANLKDTNMNKITVEGHTDSTGNRDTNIALSEKRAEAVQKYLVSRGLEDSQVEAVGLGSEKPISDNGSSKGRALNRRIDLIIE